MGKKMGINTKAAEARERKETQKKVKNEAISRQREEEYWKDDDKHVNRKIERQKEREMKAQEEKERKAALKLAYERDMELAEKSAKAKASKQQLVEVPKVTRAEIQKNIEEDEKQLSRQLRKVNVEPIPLQPNLNRLDDGESASTIDQALDLLQPTNTASIVPSASASTKMPKTGTRRRET